MSSPGRPSGSADACGARSRRPGEREPEDEELVEGEPGAPHLGLRERGRSVHRGERIGAEREPPGREHGRGQVLSDGPHEGEHVTVEVAKPPLGDFLGRRVHGREANGLGSTVEVVGGDREAVPVRTPADTDRRARGQLAGEPGLVEPRRLDLARVVRHTRREDLEPAAPPARRGADHSFDDDLLVSEEIADALARRRLLVPPRRLPEHVAHGREAEPGETAGHRRPDALERLDGGVEAFRLRRRARPRPGIRRRRAGEADRQRHSSERSVHSREPS